MNRKNNTERIKIAASMSCADFKNLGDEIRALEYAGIDILHFDVCDGYFAPTFLFSPMILKSLRQLTGIMFDVHMYCKYPSRYIDEFARSGADLFTVHIEMEEDCRDVLKKVRDSGMKAGIAVLPASLIAEDIGEVLTDVSMAVANTVGPAYPGQEFNIKGLENMRILRRIATQMGTGLDIAADGGVNETNLEKIVESGANVFIMGSTGLFLGDKDYTGRIKSFRRRVDSIIKDKN
ncbi:MAG: ribulose-phosphate 3-epimerase [Actinobacteria bacterium]|nr:ribulose-phosphate 3-epimerase [Actinomycetota bacterium]